MKKEEILAMEAGKALDILMLNTFGIMPTQVVVSRTASVQVDNIEVIVAPVSTDISAAWLVVEKLNKMGYGIMITIFDPSQVAYPINKVLCEINDPKVPFDKSTIIAKSYGDEFPEAICKAALLAKLGGEK